MSEAKKILHYWFETLTPQDWFSGGEKIDSEIRKRFMSVWERAAGGGCSDWNLTVEGTHALIILLDQFPRNMFRGSAKSFWSDALARETAGRAIAKGQDMKLPEVGRHFIYLPFMHSECLEEQERSVSLYCSRFPDTDAENLVHARAHREIIRIFGRFPYRNEALKRKTTETEAKWMAEGGYRQMVETMRSSQ